MKMSTNRPGKVRLLCLLTLIGLLLVQLSLMPPFSNETAIAADGIRDELKPVPVLGVISDVDITGLKPEVAQPSGTITLATEKPAGQNKLIADLLYPKTDAPENLTSEQLDAISKLPPKSNEAGLRVHPAVIPLFRDIILNYTGGSYKNAPIHFRLHTPEPYEKGKKYPMVVWLHGAGECGSDNIDSLSHLHHIIPYLVGPKKRDFFLLVPQCPHNHVSWEAPAICYTRIRSNGSVECHPNKDTKALGNAPLGYTIAMIEALLEDESYPIDPNRITAAGLSTGGEGTWKILERRPDLFAAAVPIVSWDAISKKSLQEKPLLKKIPIWAIYSSDDRSIDHARQEFKRMEDAGCRVSKTEFGVCGHRAWTPAMLQGDIFGWLISRAKDGDRYYAAESSPTDPEKIGTFAEVTVGDLAKKKPTLAPAKSEEPAKEKTQVAKPEKSPSVTDAHELRKLVVEKRKAELAKRQKELQEAFWKEKAKMAEAVQKQREAKYLMRQAKVFSPVTATDITIDRVRQKLVSRYLDAGEVKKALAVADKIKNNRLELIQFLLKYEIRKDEIELLDYVDRSLDQMERQGVMQIHSRTPRVVASKLHPQPQFAPAPSKEELEKKTLQPVPAGKKSPMDECGKEWAMSTENQYGLFPNGWDQEAKNIPDYVLKETGPQLCARLAKAYLENDLDTVQEICNSFIKLDDIPLASPWFDTSGGRLKGRIKYTINDKAKPVVMVLRKISQTKIKSKKEFKELAQKALDRIKAITNPKTDE